MRRYLHVVWASEVNIYSFYVFPTNDSQKQFPLYILPIMRFRSYIDKETTKTGKQMCLELLTRSKKNAFNWTARIPYCINCMRKS